MKDNNDIIHMNIDILIWKSILYNQKNLNFYNISPKDKEIYMNDNENSNKDK